VGSFYKEGKNMKNIERKKLVFIALAFLAVCAIIVLVVFAPLQRTARVAIVINTYISQGAPENNTETESIKVNGTFWNEGDITAKNLTATVIFADAAHNKVVRKNVPVSGDLLPNKGSAMEFDSEYTRERTIPKTDVNVTVQFDWMENGHLKNTSVLLYSGSFSVTIVRTTLNKTSVKLGENVNDTATITAFGGFFPTGTVTFQVKTPTADWATYNTETLTNGMNTSAAYTPEVGIGTYYFRANYSGDANYIGNQSDDNAEQMTVAKSAD
jgi:hypothetical protein